MNFLKLVTIIVIQFFCSHFSNAQSKTDSIDAYTIINNSIEAIGGKEYLQTIKTLYTDTKTEMEGREVHWIVKEMVPNKGSFQITYKNRRIYESWFNGRKGFEIINGTKKKADDDEFKNKAFKKNIFDELDYIDSSLWKLELLGEENVDNNPCYKIKATLVNGFVAILYFSKSSFYMLKKENIKNSEKKRLSSIVYSSFKKFGKLIYCTEIEYEASGQVKNGKVESLLINEMVDESDFN